MAKLILTLDTETGGIDYKYEETRTAKIVRCSERQSMTAPRSLRISERGEKEWCRCKMCQRELGTKTEEAEEFPHVIVNGSANSYMKGVDEEAETVVTGWSINVRVGELPEERSRQEQIGELLRRREEHEVTLQNAVDEDGVSTLDPGHRGWMHGAIEMCTTLLDGLGYAGGAV